MILKTSDFGNVFVVKRKLLFILNKLLKLVIIAGQYLGAYESYFAGYLHIKRKKLLIHGLVLGIALIFIEKSCSV